MWAGSDGFSTVSVVRYPQWLENVAGVNRAVSRRVRWPMSTVANEYGGQ